MIGHKIEHFTSEQLSSLQNIRGWYMEQQTTHNSIKVSWLFGLIKKGHYDLHERNMLNKMVKKYNKRLV